MRRKRIIISALFAGTLSGCATVPGAVPTGGVAPSGNLVVTEVIKVQALTVRLCAFEPTAATVAAILASLVPGAAPVTALVSQIAQSICSAVTAPKIVAFGGGAPPLPPMVNGVQIDGHFVRRR